MAKYEDLRIDQGTDVAIQLNLENPDGSKKDLSGYYVEAKMKRTYNTPDSDATMFTSITSDPLSSGIVTLLLTNEQTSNLLANRYFYDVTLSYFDSDSDTSPLIERILEGQIRVTPSV